VVRAIGLAAAGGIGVGEFVDERQVRSARDQSVKVHLLERAVLILDVAAGKDLKVVEQHLGLLAAMRLDHTDDHIRAVLASSAGLLQHLVGLADAGGGAEKNL
jgi:hypothetical protein